MTIFLAAFSFFDSGFLPVSLRFHPYLLVLPYLLVAPHLLQPLKRSLPAQTLLRIFISFCRILFSRLIHGFWLSFSFGFNFVSGSTGSSISGSGSAVVSTSTSIPSPSPFQSLSRRWQLRSLASLPPSLASRFPLLHLHLHLDSLVRNFHVWFFYWLYLYLSTWLFNKIIMIKILSTISIFCLCATTVSYPHLHARDRLCTIVLTTLYNTLTVTSQNGPMAKFILRPPTSIISVVPTTKIKTTRILLKATSYTRF